MKDVAERWLMDLGLLREILRAPWGHLGDKLATGT